MNIACVVWGSSFEVFRIN